jgi:alkylation response protein AidB-like acyl-CoA dehydrogenase
MHSDSILRTGFCDDFTEI